MKRVAAILAVLMAVTLLFSAISTAQAASTWIPGEYTGWVYFMAKTDFQFNLSGEISIQGGGVRFWESHGTLDCSVFDELGNGVCGASFPMDVVMGESFNFSMPNCSGSVVENSRANAASSGPPLAGLTASPLDQGFSMAFDPRIGSETTNTVVTGCKSFAQTSMATAGQPQWPKLDFHVEYHTPLGMGGTCSMADLPRSITVSFITSTLSLEQCEWRVLFIDPYATLPEE